MKFIIHSQLTGSQRHLFIDDEKMLWIDEILKDVYILSGEYKNNNCLDTLLRLNHVDVQFIDERYRNVFDCLGLSGQIGLQHKALLSKQHYKDYIVNIVSQINENQHLLEKDYYESSWVSQTSVFDRLQPTFIDTIKFHTLLLSDDETNKYVVKTFKQNVDGFTNNVVYDRFATRTGRLTVASGPNILTLKREYRDILKSRYKNGNICYYDFNALEVRIALYESGKTCNELDVYQYISKNALDIALERDVVKRIVIAKMYGRQKQLLGDELNIKGTKLDEYINKIVSYLNLQHLYKHTKDDFVKYGFIRNKYKRKILIDDPADHIIFNSYVQSTGVDVTLFGFETICKNILSKDDVPLFLLHDALLFDCKDMSKLPQIVWLKIPGYVQKFPVKLSIVS